MFVFPPSLDQVVNIYTFPSVFTRLGCEPCPFVFMLLGCFRFADYCVLFCVLTLKTTSVCFTSSFRRLTNYDIDITSFTNNYAKCSCKI